MKNFLLMTFCLLAFSTIVNAGSLEISLRCTDKTIEACEKRVAAELAAQKCGVSQTRVNCDPSSSTEDDAFYCSANTDKCTGTSSDGFTGVTCNVGEKVSIKDRKLTADWARTFLWIWVKDLCKTN